MVTFNSNFYELVDDNLLHKKKPFGSAADENSVMVELARYVEASIIEKYNFSEFIIPDSNELNDIPTSSVLVSNKFDEKDELLIICINQSGSQMGIFSRTMCFDEGLNKGTMIPYVKRAIDNNYGVIILRPNTNTVGLPGKKVPIPGSESPEIHALCAWENVVTQCSAKRIMLFGYGNGAHLCHELFLKSTLSGDFNIVDSIVTVEASQLAEKDDPDDIKQALTQIAVNFESCATSPRGYDLRYRRNRLGCVSLSLGLPKGVQEVTNVAISASAAVEDTFRFFTLAADLKTGMITHFHKINAQLCGIEDVNNAVTTTAPTTDFVEPVQQKKKAAVEPPKPKGIFGWMFGGGGETAQSNDDPNNLAVSDFDLLKIVGKGAFGKVMLVRKKAGFNAGKVYAMKVLKKADVIDKGQIEHTKDEQAILCKIRHPYIVCLRFSFQNEDKLYLVTDYYSGGNLFAHLRQAKYFDENRAKFYASELLLALDHLHQNEIIYRDLKLENILMDYEGHICLTDFGLSKQDILKSGGASTFCGTAEYLAPELLQTKSPYGVAVDWWSFGILLYEMMNGRTPFYDKNKRHMYARIVNSRPSFPPAIFKNPDAIRCINGLLVVEPKERLSGFQEIRKEPFFSDIDFDKLYNRELKPPFTPTGDGVTGIDYVPKAYKNADMQRESSARAMPVKDPKLALKMQTAFDGFSFSEQSIVENGGKR
jgi:serine/threonine protein kinase